jgi:tetratricopeptide (TPR) repeat protein
MKRTISNFLKMLLLAGLFILSGQEAFSQTPGSMMTTANQLYAARDYSKAIQYYQAAIKSNPNDASAYQGLGNCYYALGQKSQALEAYDKSLTLNPANGSLAKFTDKLRLEVPAPVLVVAPTPTQTGGSSGPGKLSRPLMKTCDLSVGPVFSNGMTGFGIDTTFYFPLSENFALGLSSNNSFFTSDYVDIYGDTYTDIYFYGEGLLSLKVTLSGDAIEPFLVGGVGLNAVFIFYSGGYYSSSYTYEIDPMISGGGGVNFRLDRYVSLFVQGRFATTFGNGGSFTYIPLQAGISFPL